eukprot:gene16620-22710_t
MSWPTHQRFDGLNAGEAHRVPQIATISCVEKSNIPELFENGVERYKVIVAVECPNDDILAVMRNRLKAGMIILNEEKKILTYVFAYGTVVQKKEAHELRKSARLEALSRFDEKKASVSSYKQGKKKG